MLQTLGPEMKQSLSHSLDLVLIGLNHSAPSVGGAAEFKGGGFICLHSVGVNWTLDLNPPLLTASDLSDTLTRLTR